LNSGNSCRKSTVSGEFFRRLKCGGFLENAKDFYFDVKITGANKKQLNVSKILKKRLRFYTKNNTSFLLDDFFVIEGLSSDLNSSKTTMAALDIKWSFKEDFIEKKGEKFP